MDILPDEDILQVQAQIKKLVLAWDPDYTKMTPKEKECLEVCEAEIKNGDYVPERRVWTDK